MTEKVITTKKNGMAVMLITILVLIASIVGVIFGGIMMDEGESPVLFIASLIILCIGWLPLCGLRVLKPQEALVITLFGKYKGTLKGDGFYFINPFSSSFNPAAHTKLSQSGDVSTPSVLGAIATAGTNGAVNVDLTGNKISLKIMTLNNARQKINDCLGNPVEIGIAVTWRIVDTAKAVFNVDNYKEFLSLQCDSALRNVVRIYPYDVAPNVDTTGDGEADDGSLRGSSEVVWYIGETDLIEL